MQSAPIKVETVDVPEGLAIILTPEMLEHLGATLGDALIVEETANGLRLRKE